MNNILNDYRSNINEMLFESKIAHYKFRSIIVWDIVDKFIEDYYKFYYIEDDITIEAEKRL